MTARNRRSSPAALRNEAAILRVLEAGPVSPELLRERVGGDRAHGSNWFECLVQGIIYNGRLRCREDGRLAAGRRAICPS